MPDDNVPKLGWTLYEAALQSCDPETVRTYVSAFANPEKQVDGRVLHRNRRLVSGGPFSDRAPGSPYRPKTNMDLAKELERNLRCELLELLLTEKLTAMAAIDDPNAEAEAIRTTAWHHIKIKDLKKSIALFKEGPRKTHYYNLRLFPGSHAPIASNTCINSGLPKHGNKVGETELRAWFQNRARDWTGKQPNRDDDLAAAREHFFGRSVDRLLLRQIRKEDTPSWSKSGAPKRRTNQSGKK